MAIAGKSMEMDAERERQLRRRPDPMTQAKFTSGQKYRMIEYGKSNLVIEILGFKDTPNQKDGAGTYQCLTFKVLESDNPAVARVGVVYDKLFKDSGPTARYDQEALLKLGPALDDSRPHWQDPSYDNAGALELLKGLTHKEELPQLKLQCRLETSQRKSSTSGNMYTTWTFDHL